MPSFPTSVFAPTNKSAGQTIQHTHVNDLQDEVVAIEGGFRNGTAPLNSSGSTVATLSVAGGSTFAVRPVLTPPDAARVALASTVAIGDGVSTVVTWATGDYLINSSMFSTPSSVITPQSTGLYQAVAQLAFAINSTGDRSVSILDSSGASIARMHVHASSHGSARTILNVSGTKRFDALGGSLKVEAHQNSASTLSLVVADSFFEVRKL